LDEWCDLQRELASLSERQVSVRGLNTADEGRLAELIKDLNCKAFKLLALRSNERLLIQDFVHLHLQLNKGKVTHDTMRAPTQGELQSYLVVLRDNLDAFLSTSRGLHHKIEAVTGRESAFLSIALERTAEPVPPRTVETGDETAVTLLKLRDRLRQKHSQWLYFDRSLKIYDRRALYQFKPMQRLHWTRRQAVLDADEIIAEAASHVENA
jgi:hypothetical protein